MREGVGGTGNETGKETWRYYSWAALSGLRYKPAAFDRGSFHAVEGTAEPWRKHQTGAGLDQITS